MSIQDAVLSLWNGRCTVVVREPATDPETGCTVPTERVLLENLPCRLNHYYYLRHATEGERATAYQRCALFVGPEVEIPPGSKIRVTQNGRTEDYTASGLPVVFRYHREIPMAVLKKWI